VPVDGHGLLRLEAAAEQVGVAQVPADLGTVWIALPDRRPQGHSVAPDSHLPGGGDAPHQGQAQHGRRDPPPDDPRVDAAGQATAQGGQGQGQARQGQVEIRVGILAGQGNHPADRPVGGRREPDPRKGLGTSPPGPGRQGDDRHDQDRPPGKHRRGRPAGGIQVLGQEVRGEQQVPAVPGQSRQHPHQRSPGRGASLQGPDPGLEQEGQPREAQGRHHGRRPGPPASPDIEQPRDHRGKSRHGFRQRRQHQHPGDAPAGSHARVLPVPEPRQPPDRPQQEGGGQEVLPARHPGHRLHHHRVHPQDRCGGQRPPASQAHAACDAPQEGQVGQVQQQVPPVEARGSGPVNPPFQGIGGHRDRDRIAQFRGQQPLPEPHRSGVLHLRVLEDMEVVVPVDEVGVDHRKEDPADQQAEGRDRQEPGRRDPGPRPRPPGTGDPVGGLHLVLSRGIRATVPSPGEPGSCGPPGWRSV